MSTKIKTGQISDIGTYVDAKDLTNLNTAKAYADGKDTDTLASANVHSDAINTSVRQDFATADTNQFNTLTTNIGIAKGEAISSSNGYTDAQITLSENEAVLYIDGQDAQVLASASQTAGTKDAVVLTTANSNAQYWDTLTLADAKSYTDTMLTTPSFGALKFSDGYTDGVVGGSIAVVTTGLSATIPVQVLYISSIRIITIITTHLFTASKDTYIDVNSSGVLVYTEVVNGAGAPAIAGTNQRLFKVITNGSTVTGITDLRTMIKFYQNDAEILASIQPQLDAKVDDSQVLTNVPLGALFTDTIYTHPATHAPSIIAQDSNNRFVTDAEKTAWNAKQSALTFDSVPTDASTNPVQSNGIFDALALKSSLGANVDFNTLTLAGGIVSTAANATMNIGASLNQFNEVWCKTFISDGIFNINSNTSASIAFQMAGVTKASFDNTISFYPATTLTGSLGLSNRVWNTGYFGTATITTATITTNNTSGFTALGTGAPTIKQKLLTGTTGAAQGNTVNVAHALTGDKIISFDLVIRNPSAVANSGVPMDFTGVVSRQASCYYDGTNFIVTNHATNSANILSKQFEILVTYKA